MKVLFSCLALILMLLPMGGCAIVKDKVNSLTQNIVKSTTSVPPLQPASKTPVGTLYPNITNIFPLSTTAEPEIFLDWIREFGSGVDDYAYDIALDSNNNVYTTGYTIGALDNQTYLGLYDAYLKKLDNKGNNLWTRQFGSQYVDVARGVAVDARNGIYVAGDTFGVLSGSASVGLQDCFVRKFDDQGQTQWTCQFGTNTKDEVYGMAVDRTYKSFVVGNTLGAFTGQTASGKQDCFISKLDASGKVLWTRQFGSAKDDYATNVSSDNQDGAFVVGYTDGGVFPGQTASGTRDCFIARYDSTGNQLWLHQFGSKSLSNASDVATDTTGNAYIVGWVNGSLTVDSAPITKNAFMRKYDKSGSVVWTRQFTAGADTLGYGVCCDESGGVYITGACSGSLSGEPYVWNMDIFIRKYSTSGVVTWTHELGAYANDYGYSIAVDGAGDAYISGSTVGNFFGQTSPNKGPSSLVAKFSLHSLSVAK